MRSLWGLFVTVLLLVACQVTEKEALGAYVAQGYVNTIDTIYLKPGGVYERRVYASNGSSALRKRNRWELRSDGELVLHAFFLNLDRDLTRFPELTADPGYQINTYFKRSSGVLMFCTGDQGNKNCYLHQVK